MNIQSVHTSLFAAREDLVAFIVRHIASVPENTVLAVTSKLICLWKGPILSYVSRAQKEQCIEKESDWYLKTPLAYLTVKNGMIMTNAGIDESNAQGKLLFLPPDCYALAAELRKQLQNKWHVRNLGILITDSMILPLRKGVIAAAIAYAGFKGVRDERGKPDLFGKNLEVTYVNVADSLATACALEMGERAEQRPLCLVTKAPIEFVDTTAEKEIKYPMKDDLYAPLFYAAGYKEKGDKK